MVWMELNLQYLQGLSVYLTSLKELHPSSTPGSFGPETQLHSTMHRNLADNDSHYKGNGHAVALVPKILTEGYRKEPLAQKPSIPRNTALSHKQKHTTLAFNKSSGDAGSSNVNYFYTINTCFVSLTVHVDHGSLR